MTGEKIVTVPGDILDMLADDYGEPVTVVDGVAHFVLHKPNGRVVRFIEERAS